MSRTALVLLTLAAVLIALVVGPLRWASAHGPDVNSDGRVRIDDILEVIRHYYEDVPTATPTLTPTATETATNTPTDTPTATPAPQTGGGGEQILATNVVMPLGRTHLVTIDPSQCPGSLFYFDARTTSPTRATYITPLINGYGQSRQVNPYWQPFIILWGAPGGGSQPGPVVIEIDVLPSLGVGVEVSLDMHCSPEHD